MRGVAGGVAEGRLTKRYPNDRSNSRDWGACKYPLDYEPYMKSLSGYAERRAAARAITPSGFARAFFRANSRGIGKGYGNERN